MSDSNRTDSSSSSSSSEGTARSFRRSAIDGYDSALDAASSAGRRATGILEDSPLAALGAGIAAGALVAALLPATRRERDLLRPYGDRVTGAARGAMQAGRSAGSEKLRELGLMPETLVDKAGVAAKATAEAAVARFKGESEQD